jgi:ABC-type antimicrobial peptide transport system permease subunit
MSTYLFGVTPADPVTIAGVAASLMAVGWVAAWLPARRAASILPAEALRN